jgi:hypothetical protein
VKLYQSSPRFAGHVHVEVVEVAIFDFGSGVVVRKHASAHEFGMGEASGEFGTVFGFVFRFYLVTTTTGVAGTAVLVVPGGRFLADGTESIRAVIRPVSAFRGEVQSFAFSARGLRVEFHPHCSGFGWCDEAGGLVGRGSFGGEDGVVDGGCDGWGRFTIVWSMNLIRLLMDCCRPACRSRGNSWIDVGSGRGR